MTSLQTRDFINGLVFGFDVGTASIGWAVRRGAEFLDVGVLICPEETNKLDTRRNLRRQRRTLRSRKYRRLWFARQLAKILSLELHNDDDSGAGLPKTAWEKNAKGAWQHRAGFESLLDPISLRLRALNGEELKPEELHAALTHLFKRRGYSKVPWAQMEIGAKTDKDEEGKIKKAVAEIEREMQAAGCLYPCQLLTKRREDAGPHPVKKWAREIYWPRDLLEQEFRAIIKAQSRRHPALTEKTEWLLYGDTHEVTRAIGGADKKFHVFYKTGESRSPGVLGLRWPRFDNRGPGLDSLNPIDEQGRPLHVVRKNKEAFRQAQWELALMNFRVQDFQTRKIIDPRTQVPEFVEQLRAEWNKKGKVTISCLKKLARPFQNRFCLIENQKPLTPDSGTGRARFASPTLDVIRKEINAGHRVDPPQPVLRRQNESAEQALTRYLADIKHPVVRHRMILLRRRLEQLVSRHGKPEMIVVEAVRSLALGKKAKAELNKRNEEFRQQRENARTSLLANRESASRKAIQRYRLWQEAKGRCPICLQTIARTDLGQSADIAHLVPRSRVDCNEIYNLTVTHLKCNREAQGARTPFAAFGHTSRWAEIKANAEECFAGRKREIFLSPDAESLIEQKADLQHTAYIARVIRHVALIQLGWLDESGRDPTPERQNAALRFQVTNGYLTSRLRQAWGVNQILHPLPPGKRWDDLSEGEKNQFAEKNRGDLRHHALDAMVIACTLPWLAHRTHGATDESGNHGWWTQDEKQRSKAANPMFPREGRMYEVCKEWMTKAVVHHHVSRSVHQQAYATTLYSKKAEDTYVARENIVALTPKNLANIWPEDFSKYCQTAWAYYAGEAQDIKTELKKNKGCVPEAFTRKLCFAHFQQWRETMRQNASAVFEWPVQIRIPIRRVKLISVKDDKAVVPFGSGTHAFVKRTGFKEVRICQIADGNKLMPVFIPRWKRDLPICDVPLAPDVAPVACIRLGEEVELKRSAGLNSPPGKYRVASTMQSIIQLIPAHVKDDKQALLAAGYLENGVNISWKTFIEAAGYELPHRSSNQTRSASATSAGPVAD